LPTLLTGATFKNYRYEWVVGTTIGLLLQAGAATSASLIPSIVAHTVMEVVLDGYRRRRPVPKPSVPDQADKDGLHLT
jgi:hypothetical protein